MFFVKNSLKRVKFDSAIQRTVLFLQSCLGHETILLPHAWWHGAQLLSVGNGVKKILIVSHVLEWAELIIFHDLLCSAPITLD